MSCLTKQQRSYPKKEKKKVTDYIHIQTLQYLKERLRKYTKRKNKSDGEAGRDWAKLASKIPARASGGF